MKYETETLGSEEDDGTMVNNVEQLVDAVVGHRIKFADREGGVFRLTLDDGRQVEVANTYDCCASTELDSFLLHVDKVDHVITGVGTTEGYTTWHIFADFGDVLEMSVEWSAGNPFYYAYGFDIKVVPA